jgi:predicted nucleic acid-binding protein
MKAFIDSDVLLDFFLDRQPFSEHSAAILDLCEKRHIAGITSPLVLNNVYYILRQKAGHEKTMKCMHFLIDLLQTVTMSRETVLAAIDSGFTDFEDSLQYGAVVSDDSIHCIVTRNIKDFRKSTRAVHTPAGFLALV